MEDPGWSQVMDLHLLHLLTEMPNTPAAFPEVLFRGRQSVADKDYFQTMQASFRTELRKEVEISSIRKRAAFFLNALEPTSEAVILVVRAVHACALEGTTVEDIRGRIAQRDGERTARKNRDTEFRTKDHTVKRSATDGQQWMVGIT